MSGKVYLASMNLRGNWAEAPEKTLKVNVTSAQGKDNKNRRDFSPMTPVEGGYKGYWNFESYWQSGKVFEGIPEEKTKKWWKEQDVPRRRYPNSKGKKVLHAKWEHTEPLDYIASRKKVYIPEYYQLVKDREMIQHWQKERKKGKDIVVYDFDGPRLENGEVTCREVTMELLEEKLHDTTHPFGHGYIVASLICELDVLSLI